MSKFGVYVTMKKFVVLRGKINFFMTLFRMKIATNDQMPAVLQYKFRGGNLHLHIRQSQRQSVGICILVWHFLFKVRNMFLV
jgi:hypothetical protein